MEKVGEETVEAIIAALYLDGGAEVAKSFIDRYILSQLNDKTPNQIGDCKTALQEYVQRKPGRVLSYQLVSESGPDHKKTFTVQVLLNDVPIGTGSGHTKKEAEQFAARNGLEVISK